MMSLLSRRWLVLVCVLASDAYATVTMSSSATELIFTGRTYEVRFSRANGAITALGNVSDGGPISAGSRGGCLWGSSWASGQYLGGCSFRASGRAFSYAWNPVTATLTLDYMSDPGLATAADASVGVRFDEDGFTMTLDLLNHGTERIEYVYFPSDVSMRSGDVERAYAPTVLPGTAVGPGFFARRQGFVRNYPSYAMFADFLAWDIAGTQLALYAINPEPAPVAPVYAGFSFYPDDPAGFTAYHSAPLLLAPRASWRSPAYRFLIGSGIFTSIDAFRRHNGVDAYPSLDAKLATAGLPDLRRMPFVKLDQTWMNQTFAQTGITVAALPGPLQLHPVGYWPGNVDHNHPDFLPTDPRWGSTADFAAFVRAAHAVGHVVIPYINPTNWNIDSPTMRNLPAAIVAADLWARDENGSIRTESEGNGIVGYDVSLGVPFVTQRVDALLAQFATEVPVDCVFEDQIGARAFPVDTNPAASGYGAYANTWLAHTARYANRCLMTEMGWDRLARTEIGFHGSSRVAYARSTLDTGFGAGNWSTFPLASMMFGDKVLFYHHDLDGQPTSSAASSFDNAFGYMLGIYDWNTCCAANPAFTTTAQLTQKLQSLIALQQHVSSRIVGHRVVGFGTPATGVTRSDFGDVVVIGNAGNAPYSDGTGTIAPGGFGAKAADGSIVAGVYRGTFNGAPLSAGDHTVIVETATANTEVRHYGPDTALQLSVPWAGKSATVNITSYDAAAAEIDTVALVSNGLVVINAVAAKAGRTVDHYQIRGGDGAGLATIVEYYNRARDHYFMTWMRSEITSLDAGTTAGWVRTGKTFNAMTGSTSMTVPVCRIYIPPGNGDGHFFGRDGTECAATLQRNPSFILEDAAFFFLYPTTAGVCAAGTVPVYRVFSNRPDANHRYTIDRSVRDQMVANGWLAEGDGADVVVMCAPR